MDKYIDDENEIEEFLDQLQELLESGEIVFVREEEITYH